MTHSYSKLLYHLVWSTKNRDLFINDELKNRLYGYMRNTINEKKQYLYIVNGMPDHIHMLVSLSPTICVSDFIKEIKASSTKWVRSESIGMKSFCWQEGFSAYTVGYSTQKSVIKYIENQENHHQHVTFDEEYIDFLLKQDISYDERFVLG